MIYFPSVNSFQAGKITAGVFLDFLSAVCYPGREYTRRTCNFSLGILQLVQPTRVNADKPRSWFHIEPNIDKTAPRVYTAAMASTA